MSKQAFSCQALDPQPAAGSAASKQQGAASRAVHATESTSDQHTGERLACWCLQQEAYQIGLFKGGGGGACLLLGDIAIPILLQNIGKGCLVSV